MESKIGEHGLKLEFAGEVVAADRFRPLFSVSLFDDLSRMSDVR